MIVILLLMIDDAFIDKKFDNFAKLDGATERRSDGQTHWLIEMRWTHLKKIFGLHRRRFPHLYVFRTKCKIAPLNQSSHFYLHMTRNVSMSTPMNALLFLRRICLLMQELMDPSISDGRGHFPTMGQHTAKGGEDETLPAPAPPGA